MSVSVTESQTAAPIAISKQDFDRYGCPACGGIFGSTFVSVGNAYSWSCECGQYIIVCANGLRTSPIGVGNPATYPVVQKHPREGQAINRAALIAKREHKIKADEMADLTRWLGLGYGQEVEVRQVGEHISKLRRLPIVAAKPAGSNVEVTCFAQNYYFHFLGVNLTKAVPATLLYPIQAIFGSYALSGHVNPKIAPSLTNFEKAYHNCQPLSCFGADCGTGWGGAAQTIRYLQAVSELDAEAILDVCLRKTSCGATDRIDGNHIEIEQLLEIVGLKAEHDYHGPLQDIPTDIFERVEISVFDTLLGRSSVSVTMAEGVPFPLVGFSDIYVDVRDTALGDYLPSDVQPERVASPFGSQLVVKVPIFMVKTTIERHMEENKRAQSFKYPTSGANSRAKSGTREFIINVPNPLDAIMTAFHLVKVLAPMMR